jgi:hypothetical protein
MFRNYLLFALLLLAGQSFAQQGFTVNGTVKDSTGTVPGATVTLFMGKDSSSLSTGIDGAFSFKNLQQPTFTIRVTGIGYAPYRKTFVGANKSGVFSLGNIMMKASSNVLTTVNIVAANPVKLKEDTIEFNAAAYKVQDGAPVEDMLKKLPGVDVDKDGNVTAQGKSVTKVRVNGKDFFGGDLKTATQNMPASIVQNLQIIDDYGDQANITGLKTGESEKILNITIRPDKNYGYFGQLNLGEGADDQNTATGKDEDNRYIGSGSLFKFNGDQQIAALANLNNTNASLFSFGGGGPRGGGPGGGGGGSSSSNSNGITDTRSAGFNYRDQWGKKVSVYGSYSFSDNTVNTLSSTIQSNTSLTSPSINNYNNNQTDGKINHRFNLNIEYKMDTLNYFKISPTITYAGINTTQTQNSVLTQNGALATDYNLNSTLNSSSPNFGTNILYNHKFNSTHRNLSINVSAGSTQLTQTQTPVYDYLAGTATAPLNQLIHTDVKLDSVGTNISYLEPMGKKSYLELNYAYHYAHTTSDKEDDTLATGGVRNRYDLLSNDYSFNFITNRVGLNYRYIDTKYNYTLGMAIQPSLLTGYSANSGSTSVSTLNFAPTARFVYNVSRNQSFNLNYSGASNQPTYTELQPVVDFSNSLYPVQGNASLKPEFNNNLSLAYNKFDFQSGNILFARLSFTQTDDKIVANTISYPATYTPNKKLENTILTQYENADGFYTASGNYTWAKPWQERKFTLMLNGNVSYSNNLSYISTVAPTTYALTTDENIAKSLNLTQGVKFRTSIQDVIDAEASTSYGVTSTDNSLTQNNLNNNFRTWTLSLNGKNYFDKTWTFSYDYTKTLYYGYSGATNPNILNTYIEKKFLKQNVGALRLSAFDVFNQNTGFSTTQNGNFINQTQSNRLGRYFLLTFTLRLQNFAGGQRPGGPDGGPRDGGPRGPGGGPGGFGGPPND